MQRIGRVRVQFGEYLSDMWVCVPFNGIVLHFKPVQQFVYVIDTIALLWIQFTIFTFIDYTAIGMLHWFMRFYDATCKRNPSEVQAVSYHLAAEKIDIFNLRKKKVNMVHYVKNPKVVRFVRVFVCVFPHSC